MRAAAIVRTLLLSNFVGIAFARSLHYQFLAWYGLSLPILIGTGMWHETLGFVILWFLEHAWNIHEPTEYSALVVSITHILVLAGQVMKPALLPEQRSGRTKMARLVRKTLASSVGVQVFEN
jgi:alpha-1,3-mannosyltransferase